MTTDISPDTIRAHFARITVPAALELGPHAHISDLHKFIDTQIARLDSPSRDLRRVAFVALATIAEKLGHPFPIE